MASYEIRWRRSAEKELRRIDRPLIPRIVQAVESLAGDPFPQGSQKLHGAESVYRIRVGDYRVVYQVDLNANTVVIDHVRHRREAYR